MCRPRAGVRLEVIAAFAAIMALVCALMVILPGCGGSQSGPESPECSPLVLAKAEGEYADEILKACKGYGSIEACPAAPAIELRYQEKKRKWVTCR
ncbi:MAG TPA: hypothetical protein VHO25_22325 [Polyangiaceae bacterium]|nr:hypothetical protein [Polyangiaceae bacterium]